MLIIVYICVNQYQENNNDVNLQNIYLFNNFNVKTNRYYFIINFYYDYCFIYYLNKIIKYSDNMIDIVDTT